MTNPLMIAGKLTEAERAWKRLDPHGTGVIRGEPSFYSDDPRISASQYKPDHDEPADRITLGMFLGNHRWAMGNFTPEQILGLIGLLMSKPAVRQALKDTNND